MLHLTNKSTKIQDTQKSHKMCTSAERKTPPGKNFTFTEPLTLSTLAKIPRTAETGQK